MIDCPIYYVMPGDSCGEQSAPVEDTPTCGGCNCGYVQYEGLVPYLKEINDSLSQDPDRAVELEFKLREQIVEISRLFDIDAGVSPGYFSKAHYRTSKIFTTNGTEYLKVPEHVAGTLEVRTLGDILIDSDSYTLDNGLLRFMPCQAHTRCGCVNACGNSKVSSPLPWPEGCYKVTARWGNECADLAVQKAVRDYLIEGYRVQDPVIAAATGLPISRTFREPHSWSTYIRNFKAKRRIFSQFAVA